MTGRGTQTRCGVAAVGVVGVVLPNVAAGHVERPAYWPDPSPDRSVRPAAGGKVPKARTLASALRAKPPGRTRVVCKPNSLGLLSQSVRRARKHGYDIRPTDHRKLSRKRAGRLMQINRTLRSRCEYSEIQ